MLICRFTDTSRNDWVYWSQYLSRYVLDFVCFPIALRVLTIVEVGGYFLMSSNDIILYAGIAALCVFFIVVGMWAYNRYQNRKSEYIEID
jgi:hypothetical protein